MAQTIDWEQYRQNDPEPMPVQEDSWAQFRVSTPPEQQQMPQEESWPSYIGRQLARTGSRGIETLLGMPGNIQSLLQQALVAGPEAIAGREIPVLRKILGDSPPPEIADKLQKSGVKWPSTKLPTSGDIRELTKQVTGGFTEPQNEAEQSADELVETFASLATPGGIANNLGKKAVLSVIGQGGKEAAKAFNAPEWAQEGAKLGGMVLAGSFNPGGVRQELSSLYNKMNQTYPKNATVSSKSLVKSLRSLQEDLSGGVRNAEKTTVLRAIRDVLRHDTDGQMPVKQLINARRDINAIRGYYDTTKGVKQLLKTVNGQIGNSLEEYGKSNPEFMKAYVSANRAYGAYEQSKKASKSLAKVIKRKSPESALALGVAAAINPAGVAKSVAVGYPILKTGEIATQIAKSPELAKYYGRTVTNALANNLGAAAKDWERFDQEAKKVENAKR